MSSRPWAGNSEGATGPRSAADEFLLSYGAGGDLGRFRAAGGLTCRRGDLAVVRSLRGVELATVLCPAGAGHAHLLPDPHVGELLRLATQHDRETAARLRRDGQRLFEAGRRLAVELELPLEILDAEILLDGEHAVLYHLCATSCATEVLVNRLTHEQGLRVSLYNLAVPSADADAMHGGCGAANCGQGGCGSCASGGCSTCGAVRKAAPRPEPELERRITLATCG